MLLTSAKYSASTTFRIEHFTLYSKVEIGLGIEKVQRMYYQMTAEPQKLYISIHYHGKMYKVDWLRHRSRFSTRL